MRCAPSNSPFMMAPVSRKRSLADMQQTDTSLPAEYNESDYFREVLQLEDGETEQLFDESLAQEADNLGIVRRSSPGDKQDVLQMSVRESAITVASQHARTSSTGSQESTSTGITSRSSHERLDSPNQSPSRNRSNSRRSVSFSEYDKYVLEAEAQGAAYTPPSLSAEPATSLFSVSTRRSYASIKSELKDRFRLRRNRTAPDGSK